MPSAKAKQEPFQVPIYWFWVVLVVGELLFISLLIYRQQIKRAIVDTPVFIRGVDNVPASRRAPLNVVRPTPGGGQVSVPPSSARAPIPAP